MSALHVVANVVDVASVDDEDLSTPGVGKMLERRLHGVDRPDSGLAPQGVA